MRQYISTADMCTEASVAGEDHASCRYKIWPLFSRPGLSSGPVLSCSPLTISAANENRQISTGDLKTNVLQTYGAHLMCTIHYSMIVVTPLYSNYLSSLPVYV